jgi:hypothetical protein
MDTDTRLLWRKNDYPNLSSERSARPLHDAYTPLLVRLRIHVRIQLRIGAAGHRVVFTSTSAAALSPKIMFCFIPFGAHHLD